jgi:hypothetical protein
MTEVRGLCRWLLGAFIDVQPFINAALGLAVVVYIIRRLLCCSSQYSPAERLGMSLTASGMVMATPALWIVGTPFDGWSFNVARAGLTIYIFTGGLRRDRHRKLNLKQQAYAEGWNDGRFAGKRNGAR